MDDADRAQLDIERHLQAAIDAARGIPSPTNRSRRTEAVAASDCCAECGDLIPSERQLAIPGCTLCVDCAEYFEGRR